MPIRFILKQLLMPPGVLLLLIALGWWLRRRFPRLAFACFAVGFGGLWLMSLPAVTQWSAAWLEREPVLEQAQWATLAQRADAIVILGAGREQNDPGWGRTDQPGLMALERLRYAARLARASGLPLAATGGLHYGQLPSEAALMADAMRLDYGLEIRWLEEQSRTTWENAVRSAELLQPQGVRRVVLVTQAWHMQRARWSFEQAGFEVITAPMGYLSAGYERPLGGWLPESRAIWQSSQLLNEAIGLLAYPIVYGKQ
ncbi:YdcF family protein [Pseudomonas sediminis]|uniref:YdcF family protein n=1 Tax=Pseudomonas sediminis TaxID=1691904 RepID=UPI001179D0BE|nr:MULTISPECIES: YdcF family protein [Pseudomonas aeruginosa group]TRO23641.1 YdcF family protein [Pseudomonas mendocina]TRO28192.1 YdcF family protein [Pseudomonas mendocina]